MMESCSHTKAEYFKYKCNILKTKLKSAGVKGLDSEEVDVYIQKAFSYVYERGAIDENKKYIEEQQSELKIDVDKLIRLADQNRINQARMRKSTIFFNAFLILLIIASAIFLNMVFDLLW